MTAPNARTHQPSAAPATDSAGSHAPSRPPSLESPLIHPSLDEFIERSRRGNLIPVSREMLADLETPVSAFLKITRGNPFAFLLESVEQGEQLGRYSFLGIEPLLTFKSKGGEHEVIFGSEEKDYRRQEGETPLETLRHLMRHFRPVTDPRLPADFGGAVGYLSYDIVRDLETLPATNPDDLNLPDALFMIAQTMVIFDHVKRKMILVVNAHVTGDPATAYYAAQKRLSDLHDLLRGPLTPHTQPRHSIGSSFFAPPAPPTDAALAGAAPIPRPPTGETEFATTPSSTKPLPPAVPLENPLGHPTPLQFTSNFTPEGFKDAVLRAKEYILAGDAFQIVISQRFTTRITCDPFNIYRAIRHINPSPYLFYLQFGDLKLAGSSPEILVNVQDDTATVRPIAGTRKRGATPAEDKALAEELLADEKECAEHIMLVDLGRNDLGRICEFGSVNVDQLMIIEKYSHVMHIVSNVHGKLRAGEDGFSALAATFPAGTLSGAPKIRAMEIIEELEPLRRGPYGGSVALFSFTGNLKSCITIRTAVIKGNTVHVQAGAGIVADSVPESEYQETVNKARAMMHAIDIAERGID